MSGGGAVRGQKLKKSLSQSQERLMQSWTQLWPSLLKSLQKHIGVDQINAFVKDPIILDISDPSSSELQPETAGWKRRSQTRTRGRVPNQIACHSRFG